MKTIVCQMRDDVDLIDGVMKVFGNRDEYGHKLCVPTMVGIDANEDDELGIGWSDGILTADAIGCRIVVNSSRDQMGVVMKLGKYCRDWKVRESTESEVAFYHVSKSIAV